MKWGVCAANAQGQYNFEDKSYAKDSHAGVAHRGYSSVVY